MKVGRPKAGTKKKDGLRLKRYAQEVSKLMKGRERRKKKQSHYTLGKFWNTKR